MKHYTSIRISILCQIYAKFLPAVSDIHSLELNEKHIFHDHSVKCFTTISHFASFGHITTQLTQP